MANELWTIGRMLQWLVAYFTKHEIETPRLDADLLVAEVLDVNRLYLYTHFERPIEASELARLKTYIQRRIEGYSVAAIVGKKEFMRLPFVVTKDVLIPRPATETLVETVLEHCGETPLRVLDIGTGSGAIILSLLHYRPQWTGIACDISAAALAVARQNAARLEVSDRVEIIESDLFHSLADQTFDIIVSNPPYIPNGEIEGLAPEVRNEPMTALRGGEDGLAIYRRMIPAMVPHLRKGALCAVEIGAEQGAAVSALVREVNAFSEPAVRQDLQNLDRVVWWKRI
ncbi:peptide chain release factor N(5)-glutamine methyltransferase [Negativicoccus succinicivorans]